MTREEAIFILERDNPNNIAIRTGFESLYDQRKEAFSMAIKALEQEPRKGHWVLTEDDFVYCSECEDSYYPRPIDASWYYCPHCGCRMVEPQESEEQTGENT